MSDKKNVFGRAALLSLAALVGVGTTSLPSVVLADNHDAHEEGKKCSGDKKCSGETHGDEHEEHEGEEHGE